MLGRHGLTFGLDDACMLAFANGVYDGASIGPSLDLWSAVSDRFTKKELKSMCRTRNPGPGPVIPDPSWIFLAGAAQDCQLFTRFS